MSHQIFISFTMTKTNLQNRGVERNIHQRYVRYVVTLAFDLHLTFGPITAFAARITSKKSFSWFATTFSDILVERWHLTSWSAIQHCNNYCYQIAAIHFQFHLRRWAFIKLSCYCQAYYAFAMQWFSSVENWRLFLFPWSSFQSRRLDIRGLL